MPREPDSARRLLEQPGRLAAVGGAAVVCLLSVSGALGFSFTGSQAGAVQDPRVADAPRIAVGGAADLSTSPPAGDAAPPVQQTPPDTQGTGSSQQPKPKADPGLPARSGTGKRIVFGVAEQRVWLVGPSGKVVRTYLVSGSKYDNLDLGTYHVTSRSRYATAYNSNETLNYMVRFTYGRTAPIGFHAIPVREDGTLAEPRSGLGKPASAGCIRQWVTDARALWNFAPVGTTVVVLA